ncbi:putative auxin efflux carrier component 6 isoform X1 [Iris pallida]|uniref:Auxin efflux carrier component n=1 Tax=Iris pallida TaxID=29817 RepID=A0AAX6HK27_IRIPA|nr:putative auxin efflux carrier component 6 isoform X1 [Iris pallida]
MIGWEDVYKVVSAMVPLYVALGLGYGSIRWWRIFTKEQSEAISRLVSFFTLPLFTLEFTLHIDPFAMNYRFIAADAVSKLVILLVLAAWAKCNSKGSYCWTITSFSLSTLTNSLVMGVPLLNAMYGRWAQDLVVQISVIQAIVWLTMLLFVLEVRKSGSMGAMAPHATPSGPPDTDSGGNGGGVVVTIDSMTTKGVVEVGKKPSLWCLMKIVWLKLAMNPNSYASILGLTWAFIANRWHFEMPAIMEDSVLIMSKAGTGMAMFSMGLFMASQEKLITCGPGLTVFSMVLRFVAGPAAMAIGAIAVGLHGNILRVAIIQAALPQSITSFIFAREYGLHADVLSTAVIFGMLVSLPVLVAYYVLLGFLS